MPIAKIDMTEPFDAYYKWLSIPPAEQPPNHYRLLGVALFEQDLDVIEYAADRQMSHIRNFQSGAHAGESQRILNEISNAKITLLETQKKSAYDAELSQRLNPPLTAPAAANSPAYENEWEPPPANPLGVRSFKKPRKDGSRKNVRNSLILAGLAIVALVLLFFFFRFGELSTEQSANREGARDANSGTTTGTQGPASEASKSASKTRNQDPENQPAKDAKTAASPIAAKPIGAKSIGDKPIGAKPSKAVTPNSNAAVASTGPIAKPEDSVIKPETSVGAALDCAFDDKRWAQQHLDWSDDLTFAADGAKAPRGPKSHLRTRRKFAGNVVIDTEFKLGRAKFTNTGGCWITVWGTRLSMSNKWQPLHAKVHIHREGNEIVFRLNGVEKRVPIAKDEGTPTAVEVRWRSRSSHFRRLVVSADSVIDI